MPKNKYNIIVFLNSRSPLRYKCSNLIRLTKFLNLKFPDWKYYNKYDHESRMYVGREYHNNN